MTRERSALAPTMIKASALSVLACGLLCLTACQSDAEPAAPNTVGSGSGGAAGSLLGVAGATATAGSAGRGGGSVPAGASAGGGAAAQAGQAGSSTGGGAGSGGSGELPALEECASQPSIDRLTSWSATNEGTMVPANGSILVKEGADYVGKVQFVGAGWHVVPVLIANEFDVTADLSKASGITLTYSATSELHVQLRSKSHWSGGSQYATTIPSTGGKKETRLGVRRSGLEELVRRARALVRRHVEGRHGPGVRRRR